MLKQKIKNRYLSLKRRIADALQKKSDKLSVKSKKLLLFLFCFVFASASIVTIVSAVTAKTKHVALQAKMPRIIQQKEQPSLPFISKQEFMRIEDFKKRVYLLPKYSFDSFMAARPKLMDSIQQIEQYYQSQK